jgi:glucose/arabinose dehydrogenase
VIIQLLQAVGLAHTVRWLVCLLAAGLVAPLAAKAQTVWTNTPISFTNYPGSDPTLPSSQDRMTPNVWLTRDSSHGPYNARYETTFTAYISPYDTEWANGTTANYASLSYTDWYDWSKGVNPMPTNTVGVNAVLHLISEDIYMDIKFTSWGSHGTGGFSYIRSTPPNIPPSVTLTNPASGAVLVAPATVMIGADASDPDGTVTNVQFFDGASSLGNVAASPYLISASLAIGSHTLVAVATDNLGATNISTPVTVTVLAFPPPNVSFITPTNGSFFTAPATIILAAAIVDTNTTVTNVDFFDNAAFLGRAAGSPFSILTNLVIGAHNLTALTTDNLGTTNTSSSVAVTVTASNAPVNLPQFTGIGLSNKLPSPPLTTANVPIITNGLVTLGWLGDARSKFDLQYATSLGNNSVWNLAQPNIVGASSGINIFSDPPYLASSAFAPNTNVFYRLNALPPAAPGLAINPQVVASNLVSPIALTHAGDGSGRLFIADQVGQIWIVDNTGTLLSKPFLDISNKLVTLMPGYDERGLLGLAFHPGYSTNGRFFVYYSAPSPDTNYDSVTRLSEFDVSTNNPNIADTNSERILMTIPQPQFNHKGAQIAFGPDGYLYFGPGDGGAEGDPHGPFGNGQVLTNYLGKMLRIDVNSGSPYAVPPDNPFLSVTGALPEIYAYGLRNPWRFSFDRGGTHQCFVADVGQNLWEELDILRKGGNYGWRILEGNHIFDPTVVTALGVNVPALDYPIFEYGHGPIGISIIGGFVYRGTNYPAMNGQYVFGDFSTSFAIPDGQIYYLSQTRPGIWELFPFQLWPTNARFGRFIKGFGEDEAGEIYVLSTTILGPTGQTGDVRRLAPP